MAPVSSNFHVNLPMSLPIFCVFILSFIGLASEPGRLIVLQGRVGGLWR
jgi:hypothetical protein